MLGIAAVVVLITVVKMHPFLALILGSAVLGLVAALGAAKTIDSFGKGVGATVTSVGLLIALGAMIGGLLADSGGADRIVDTHRQPRPRPGACPGRWRCAAALIGLPLFFEIGVVLLVPVVLLVARRSDVPLMKVGIPALAGLSVLHGLVPPHPGPLVAISALKADLGLTLLYGIIIAIPTVIIAGPLLGNVIARHVHAEVPTALLPTRHPAVAAAWAPAGGPRTWASRTTPRCGRATVGSPARARTPASDVVVPRFGPVVATVLLPVVAHAGPGHRRPDARRHPRSRARSTSSATRRRAARRRARRDGHHGLRRSARRDQTSRGPRAARCPPIAGILLIVAAGGGFKQVLVDSGVGNVVADAAKGSHLSVLVLGWLVAVGIRLRRARRRSRRSPRRASSAGWPPSLTASHLALLVLAIGSGSLFFSHVNDAGFWLVKEYFGLSVGETIKSWSVMETVISVVGLIGVLILSGFV